MISIRRRLLLGAVLAVTASSALASAGAWLSVRTYLTASADRDLAHDAAQLLSCLRLRGEELHCAGLGQALPVFTGWWLVLDPQGAVRLSSAPEAVALADAPDGPGNLPGIGPVRVARSAGAVVPAGMHGRRGGEAQAGPRTMTVVAARSTQPLEATMRTVAWALATAVALAAILAGVVSVLLSRAVISPIDRIARAIAGARPDDQRIGLGPDEVPRELACVVERADAFLAGTRDLLRRERQAAANIAHELRTPLAGLAATIECVLVRERSPAAYREALERSRGMVGDTARLVDQLLLLTRLESGREPVRRQAIPLQEAVADALTGLAEAARERRITLPSPGNLPEVGGDPGHLALVLRNLLGNAVAHAPVGSVVELRHEPRPAGCLLEIANPAGGLQAADLPHLAEPFWRGDPGRAGTGLHAGLGLALCQRLCALDGWRLAFRLADGRFLATLELPAAP